MIAVGTKSWIAAITVTFTFMAPSWAQAQDQRFRASFGPATTNGTGDASLALSGSFGYRFAKNISFEVDITGINAPADRFENRMFDLGGQLQGISRIGNRMTMGTRFGGNTGRMPGGVGQTVVTGLGGFDSFRGDTDGQTVIGTIGFRYELPVQGGRLRPYVGAGLGLARTTENFSLTGAGRSGTTADFLSSAGLSSADWMARGVNRGTLSESVAHMEMAASAGVGASLRVFRDLSVDMDARYFRLSREHNLVRLGGGVSYRF